MGRENVAIRDGDGFLFRFLRLFRGGRAFLNIWLSQESCGRRTRAMSNTSGLCPVTAGKNVGVSGAITV